MAKMNKAMLKVFSKVISFVPSVRKSICGMLVDFEEKFFVVTDGKILIAIKDENLSGVGKVVVPQEAIDSVVKLAGKNTPIKFTERTISAGSGEVEYTPMNVTYPDWKKVIPADVDENECGQFGFYHSKHLSIMEQVVEIVGEVVEFHLPKEHSGILKVKLGCDVTIAMIGIDQQIHNKYFGDESDGIKR